MRDGTETITLIGLEYPIYKYDDFHAKVLGRFEEELKSQSHISTTTIILRTNNTEGLLKANQCDLNLKRTRILEQVVEENSFVSARL